MRKQGNNILRQWNDNAAIASQGQSDDQGLTDLAEVTRLLVQQRQQLQRFIQDLGDAARHPIDLRRYTEEIVNMCEYTSVDDRRIMELANNTIRKMKNNKKLKRNWNKEDLTILLWVLEHHNRRTGRRTNDYADADWKYVAQFVPGKNPWQCMFKWLSLKKHNLSQHPWTEKEEELLNRLVAQKGKNKWIQISQDLYLQAEQNKVYRSPKQCREHWTCYMDPDLKKGPWTPREDLTLLKEFLRMGKRWSEISKKLNGRTENAVKNRFNLLMWKQEKQHGRKRSHEHFSQLWVQSLQQDLWQNGTVEAESGCTLFQQNKQQTTRVQRLPLLENEMSAQTTLFDFQSKVSLRVAGHDPSGQTNVRFIKFKKISLNELLKMSDLHPAIFNQQSMQVVYKEQPMCLHSKTTDHETQIVQLSDAEKDNQNRESNQIKTWTRT